MVDPSTLAMINAGSNVLGSVLRKPAKSSSAVASGYQMDDFDFSGWSVATGNATAGDASGGAKFPPWMILAGVVVVALAWKNKKG